jgi:hypothetical protein
MSGGMYGDKEFKSMEIIYTRNPQKARIVLFEPQEKNPRVRPIFSIHPKSNL